MFLFVCFKSHGRRKGEGKEKMSRIKKKKNDSTGKALINPTSHPQGAFQNAKRT